MQSKELYLSTSPVILAFLLFFPNLLWLTEMRLILKAKVFLYLVMFFNRLILPNLISASVMRHGRLLLSPRWSLSWLTVLKTLVA